jgi:predicted Ser/Thr protein kinase
LAETTQWRDVGRLRAEDPREVAGFEVVGRLGTGGMGVVYLATHAGHGTVALKFLRDAAAVDASFRDRFRREVEAARRVSSPRVAPVVAADPDAETPWLATAFVDGPTLQEAVADGGPMAGDRLVALAVALADALAAIHRAKVVHRDLKPANILLTAETPVVIDFGIASMREAPALTRTGMAVGTPGWMAPEQVRGRRCGPRADVFTWALVVAYAASGKPPFGRGSADAVFYRIVHEAPTLPALPPPLDDLVREALTKDPRRRPGVAHLLATLTAATAEVTAVGTTAIGATLADRTAVVPTIVALGWGVDALPARPGGRPRSVDLGPPEAPPPAPPPPPPPPPLVGQGFWFLGAEHRDARSLAAAFQAGWDDAIDQLFRRRDPVWLGELQTFLQALDLTEASGIVAAGAEDRPPAACMARLLLAIDPHIEARVGSWSLTPDGLAAAAQGVLDGREPGRRLAEIGAARVLRLWRRLPGLDRAASIDEHWHANAEAFDRRVAAVSPQAGVPSEPERQQALATLLLCAVHPDHERQLERRLAAARRTLARRQAWWAHLADEGERSPAAAMLAVMTAPRARTMAEGVRAAQRAQARQRRQAEHAGRQQRRQAARVASAPYRCAPLPRAQSGVRHTWVLVLMVSALLVHLWAARSFGDELVAHYRSITPVGDTTIDRLDTYRDAAASTGLATLLVVLLPGAHLLTRKIVRQGADRRMVRLYAAGAAAVDLLLGLTLVPAATVAGLVLGAGLDGATQPGAVAPFDPGEPWPVVAVLLPLGLVGVVLVVRSCWRLGRVVLGRPVAGPVMPMPG